MSDKPARLSRRDLLAAALIGPASYVVSGFSRTSGPPEGGDDEQPSSIVASDFSRTTLQVAPSRIVPADAGADVSALRLTRTWNGDLCRSSLANRGRVAVRVKEVVLFDAAATLPPDTQLYGEGFQMLTQTGGTVGTPIDFSQYTDAKHYKIADPPGGRAFYGLATLTPPGGGAQMFAFTSCRRFSGSIRLLPGALQIVVDTEGLAIAPGETWALEEFMSRAGADRDALLAGLGARLAANHPVPRAFRTPPTGWCSWYCFGPRVTARNVLDNLDAIAKDVPGLTYIQIDDGYQPAMGDWLETGTAFGGNVQSVLAEIRSRGFQPAIWVAPFVAEEASHVFQQHRDWFVRDGEGAPLRSDRVTFGGWRRGPWYVLDGTHPEVQRHFVEVFRTMRREWGCTYFKLDANFWGAIHGGRFHDPRATRVEAYRRGMEAIRRGAGDGFILGCNHPIWPSIGLIHGSRSSNDIRRAWDRVSTTARQNLSRNWQNGRLWWNDPDAICLTGELSDDEFQFHATAIYATGGMVLSGDDLTAMPAARLAMLRRLLPPTGRAAAFEGGALDVGRVAWPRGGALCLFNWGERPRTFTVPLARPAVVKDFWGGEPIGRREHDLTIADVPPHGARLLILEDV